jgi:hypothetical protein
MRLNNASKFKPFYDNQSPWLRIGNQVATGVAIQNPFTFYYVNNNDWSSSHSYQFWNKNFTNAVWENNEVTLKTIYSTSPSGFVEPKAAAFTGFTSTGSGTTNSSQFNISGSFNKGWNFYTNGWNVGGTIFFNAGGTRDVTNSNGNILYVGERGKYWTVGATSTSRAGRLANYSLYYIYPYDAYYRALGHNCWPVKE